MKARSWTLIVALTLLAPRARAADPDLRACVASYESGQQGLRKGELHAAHEALLVCARAPCPREMWADCARWLDEVERKTPSIVIVARDGSGREVVDVRVSVDDRPAAERLDGRAIELDPGERRVVLRWGDRAPVEQVVVLREGEKSRVITVDLEPRRRVEAPTSEPRGASAAPYIVGGLGVVALGAFGYFGLSGRSDYFDLEHTCSPHCSSSETAPVKTKLLVADIALGVSVVALVAATYLFLREPARSGSHRAQN